MRTSPAVSLCAVVAFLVLSGIPVWLLTRQDPSPPAAVVEAPVAKPVDALLSLAVSSPGHARVIIEGREVVNTPLAGEKAFLLPFPARGADLVVQAVWEHPTTPQALRVVVSADGETLADQSLWGAGSVEDVVTVPAAP
jgi:hypothetical protein